MNTYTVFISLFFALVLTFFTARDSRADVWACPQANGSVLYTNEPQETGCEKFEPQSEVIYLPARTWTDLPTPEAADENQELNQPDAPTAGIEEEQTIASSNEGEGYNSPENSFWSFEKNRIYTWVYTYTPGFSGIHPSRPRHLRDFKGHSRPKHDSGHRVPRFRQSPPRSLSPTVSPTPAEPRHFRENSVRRGAPTLPQSVSPPSSRHFHDTSKGTKKLQ